MGPDGHGERRDWRGRTRAEQGAEPKGEGRLWDPGSVGYVAKVTGCYKTWESDWAGQMEVEREGGREGAGGFQGEQWDHQEMRHCRASRSLLYDQKLKVPGPLSPERTADKNHLESFQTPDAQAALWSS